MLRTSLILAASCGVLSQDAPGVAIVSPTASYTAITGGSCSEMGMVAIMDPAECTEAVNVFYGDSITRPPIVSLYGMPGCDVGSDGKDYGFCMGMSNSKPSGCSLKQGRGSQVGNGMNYYVNTGESRAACSQRYPCLCNEGSPSMTSPVAPTFPVEPTAPITPVEECKRVPKVPKPRCSKKERESVGFAVTGSTKKPRCVAVKSCGGEAVSGMDAQSLFPSKQECLLHLKSACKNGAPSAPLPGNVITKGNCESSGMRVIMDIAECAEAVNTVYGTTTAKATLFGEPGCDIGSDGEDYGFCKGGSNSKPSGCALKKGKVGGGDGKNFYSNTGESRAKCSKRYPCVCAGV